MRHRLMTSCSISLAFAFMIWGAAAHTGGHSHMASAIEAERAHRFELAEHHLHAILDQDPRNFPAWLKLASLETVRGDLSRARAACAAAARLSELLTAVACRGRLALAGGADAEHTLQTLLQTLDHPLVYERSDPIAQWTWGVAAELAAAVGDTEAADRLFERALIQHAPLHLEAAYLDHLLATDRAQRVLDVVPDDDQTLAIQLRRMLAVLALGQQPDAAIVATMDATFRTWIAAEDFTHGREMAMFYLRVRPDLGMAQLAALRNLHFQREREDLRLCRDAFSHLADQACNPRSAAKAVRTAQQPSVGPRI